MVGVAFAALIGRLFYYQCIMTGILSTKAAYNQTAQEVLPHHRGTIYDRNGNALAVSVDAMTVAVIPSKVKDPRWIANNMAKKLGSDLTVDEYYEKLTGSTYQIVARKVDYSAAEELRQLIIEENIRRNDSGSDVLIDGIEFIRTTRREYPYEDIAGTVVGVVDEDGNGLTGIEKRHNDILTGVDGLLIERRGITGEAVVGGQISRDEAQDGTDIVLSIDIDIQREAQEQLAQAVYDWGAREGCVVVMQCKTGELLACASTPYLNPADLRNSDVLSPTLKCVSYAYEPGSTFKPITAAMAVELGLAEPTTVYDVPAQIEVGTDLVGDVDLRTEEVQMTLTNILERSSNVGAVMVAESVGAQQFSRYSERFKIGMPTGIDFDDESYGIVPKLKDYTGAWTSMSFGQGLAVPPVQMARAIGAIANEGIIVEPHFLIAKGSDVVTPSTGERVISTATAHKVGNMMYSVIENGYGISGRVEGYRLSGKTGTSERLDPNTGTYSSDSYTASFIGFGPTQDPQVLVYVLVDDVPAGGSQVVGQPWSAIMLTALQKLQIAPTVT